MEFQRQHADELHSGRTLSIPFIRKNAVLNSNTNKSELMTYRTYSVLGQGSLYLGEFGSGNPRERLRGRFPDALSFSGGSNSSGQSFALSPSGLLFMLGNQHLLSLPATGSVLIDGRIFVLGDNSDLDIRAAGAVLIENEILVNHQINISGGGGCGSVRVQLSSGGTSTTWAAGGNIRSLRHDSRADLRLYYGGWSSCRRSFDLWQRPPFG